MIRGSDLTWTVVFLDGSEATLIPADIQGFDFQYGAQQQSAVWPRHFHAHGEITLNRALTIEDAEDYAGLRVEAGGIVYFDLLVRTYDIYKDTRLTRFRLQSRGAKDAIRELEWGFRPIPAALTETKSHLTTPGLSIVEVAGAPLRGIELTAENRLEETTVRTLLTAIEGLGDCVLIEDVSVSSPTWMAIPLPVQSGSDTRTALRHYGPPNDLVIFRTLRVARSREWAADEYMAKVEGTPFEVETLHLPNSSVSAEYGGGYPYYLGVPRNLDRRAKTWTVSDIPMAEQARFASFKSMAVHSASPIMPASDRYLSPDGSYIGIVFYADQTIRINADIEYYLWRDDFSPNRARYFANGKTSSEKRTIGNSPLVIYGEGVNLARLQSLINDWDNWQPRYATVEFLVDDLDADGIASRRAGDRVLVNVDDISHFCVIMSVGWRLRGNRVLRVKWDVILQVPRGRLAQDKLAWRSAGGLMQWPSAGHQMEWPSAGH